MRVLALIAVLAVLLPACGTSGGGAADDPFTADMKMICAAGQGRDDLPPEMRRIAALKEIAAKVRTPEAARLMAGVGELAPADRPAYMKGALERAKIAQCRLLEMW